MKPVEIKKGIYWVGGIDWDLRNFHGYLTERGSTYNAYLIMDKKITLIDTVKHYKYDEMIERISKIVDPAKIDYVVSNHVEMDHSGSLPKLMELIPNADIYTSPNGKKGLSIHYKKNWNFKEVKTGDVLNIGKRNLNFVQIPMVHWPDSMVTYIGDDKLLLSNDAFGQHIASFERFDDEVDFNILMEQAAKYYANIVLPFGDQVLKALDAVSSLDIDMIAPSHGIIWRSHIKDILEKYKKWASNIPDEKAVIVFDSMWESTKKIAYAIYNAFEEKGIKTEILNLGTNHISDVMTEVLEAKYICVGSPTLNNGMLPTVASFLTYLKGLAPRNRKAIAFGSYGWGGQSIGEIASVFDKAGFEQIAEPIKVNYVPDEEDLRNITQKVLECLK
ncbi:MBL fold metallo-hydrolase [bacterium]|nr:MBL fold metallo-hydrolase [bacterium]